MKQMMNGVPVVDSAHYAVVPAAAVVLAERGAALIEVGQPARGAARRGILTIAGTKRNPEFDPMLAHSDHAGRSIGGAVAMAKDTAGGPRCIVTTARRRSPATASSLRSLVGSTSLSAAAYRPYQNDTARTRP